MPKMKIGSVLRLKDPRPPNKGGQGWLWVYEGKNGHGFYMFKSVASGDIEIARYPWRVFENWEDGDEGR
jgi:hypothetical protein